MISLNHTEAISWLNHMTAWGVSLGFSCLILPLKKTSLRGHEKFQAKTLKVASIGKISLRPATKRQVMIRRCRPRYVVIQIQIKLLSIPTNGDLFLTWHSAD